jgi:hypothetical protein
MRDQYNGPGSEWLTAQAISDVLGVDVGGVVEVLSRVSHSECRVVDSPEADGKSERFYSPEAQRLCREELGVWGNESRAIRRGRGID